MSIKHVVFDWDGTLADTYPVISAAYNHSFDSLGLPRVPYDEIKRITSSLQNRDNLACLFGERKQEASEAYYAFISEHHATKLEAIPQARELLDYCHQQGFKCYLLTNKKTMYVTKEIEKLGFQGLFDKVIAAGQYSQDKPHPVATLALFDEQLPPADEILVIGDGEADVKVARTYDHDYKSAQCILYDPNHKYQGEKPDFIVTSWREAIQIIGGLNA